MNRNGFILMQLLVATALAGILAASMLALFYQLTKQRTVVDNRMSIVARATLCTQQMMRDISGTFLPLPFEQTDQVSTTTPQDQQQNNAQQQPQGAQQQKPEEKKEELQHIFYAKERDSMLDMLSVITTNPLQVYWSEQVGKAKPRVARVVYRVETDDRAKQSFKLTRQEAATLELAPFEKNRDGDYRPYTLITGIKSLKAVYYYVPSQEPEKKSSPANEQKEKAPAAAPQESQQKQEKQEKVIYEQAREWIVRKNEREQENEKKKLPLTPTYVELQLELWDERFEKSHEFTYTIPIAAEVEKVGRIRRVRESTRLLQQAQAQNKPAQPAKQGQQGNKPLTAPKQAQLTRPANKNTGTRVARNTARPQPQAPKRPIRT